MECWLFARDHLKEIHTIEGSTLLSTMIPLFLINIVLIVLLFVRIAFMKTSIALFEVLATFDVLVLTCFIVAILMQIVTANVHLKGTHMKVLQTAKISLSDRMYKLCVNDHNMDNDEMDPRAARRQRRNKGAVAETSSKWDDDNDNDSDSDNDYDNSTTKNDSKSQGQKGAAGGAEMVNVLLLQKNKARDAKEQEKALQRVKRRRVQLMEAINLRVEAAIAMVSNDRLDEPLKLMGVTVDMQLAIQIASLAVTGLASGVFALTNL